MTSAQFDLASRACCRRRPFRAFAVEFVSGERLVIRHPEIIRHVGGIGGIYTVRVPDGGFVAFAAEDVARLLDTPIAPAS